MNLLANSYKEYLIDTFLQYPIICSTLAICFTWVIPLYHLCGGHWERIALSLAIIELFTILASINLIPVLVAAPTYLILRPTPSCSTYDDPERYMCITLKDHQHVFYVTTRLPQPNDLDASLKNATKYYIISSWRSSPDDLITIEPAQFQPENLPDENKPAYWLPEGYGVRSAGQSGEDKQIKVTLYSISNTGKNKYVTLASSTQAYSKNLNPVGIVCQTADVS